MKNTQISTCLRKKYLYQILDNLSVEVEIEENPYNLEMEQLFSMAARINKKRSFLFVSKVLGKHLPIHPHKGLLTASLLGVRYIEQITGESPDEKEGLLAAFKEEKLFHRRKAFIPADLNPVIIGFAETATALGHAFFESFQSGDFFHTTREQLAKVDPLITFEEEHSHASSHRCYIPKEVLDNNREIILVDDEVTTGKTALNIIQSIHSNYPRMRYTLVSILDWRSNQDKSEFDRMEKKLGIEINCVSLVSGGFSLKKNDFVNELSGWETKEDSVGIEIEHIYLQKELKEGFHFVSLFSVTPNGKEMRIPYLAETGRFGLKAQQNYRIKNPIMESASFLAEKRKGTRTLCLGTGEFMFIPMKIAAEMGEGVLYQSTTRSPVYVHKKEGYGANHGLSFPNPEDHHIQNYVYNIAPGSYDEIFIFFEREISKEAFEPMKIELERLGIPSVKLVFFSGEKGGLQIGEHA